MRRPAAFTPRLALGLILTGALGAAGCTSGPKPMETHVVTAGTPLEAHDIGVRRATEVLEIEIAPGDTALSRAERYQVAAFAAAYRDRGHGTLLMAMPTDFANPQGAIEAVSEARAIAWENGIAWEAIEGDTYDAGGAEAAPLVLAFDVYEAVAPDCQGIGAFDLADVSSNNELGYFGCSVRYNLAAMIADPGDLLGEREIGPRDNRRLQVIMDAYRQGAPTGAAQGEESVNVSGVGG